MIAFSLISLFIFFQKGNYQLLLKLIKTPLVFPIVFIFITFLISPILYYYDLSYFKFWLGKFNKHFFSVNYQVFLIFLVFLVCFFVGFKFKLTKSITLPKLEISKYSAGIGILISVLLLIYMVGGNIFNYSFNRKIAVGYVNQSGFGRYLLFIPLLTFSLPIFLKTFQKYKPRNFILVSVMIYLLLVPFFGISSGRGTLLFPIIMIVFVNFNLIEKLSVLKIVMYSFILIILMIGLDGIRSGKSFISGLENSTLVFINISDAFSRFDSTYAGLSTFVNEDWDFLYGQSYFYGLFQIFPPNMINYRDLTITPFLAKAIHNDIYFNIPSGIASSIIFESYVNFGFLGTIFSGIFTGYYFRLSYKLFHSKYLEYKVLAFHLAWMNPFGVSFALFFYDLFYKIIFPIVALIIIQSIFKNNTK